jgi:hypothetical protein
MNPFIYRVLLVLVTAIFSFTSSTSMSQVVKDDEGNSILLSKKRKKRKKRRSKNKQTFGAETGSDGIGSDTGVHRDQEGVDAPYWAHMGGAFTYNSLSTKSGEGDAVPSSNIGLAGSVLLLIMDGMIEVGPWIEYGSYTYETTTTTYDAAGAVSGTESASSTTTSMLIGGLAVMNFANIDKSMNIPFAEVGFGLTSGESGSGDTASKKSGTKINLGGGLHLMLDSNIALTPKFTYTIQSSENDADEPVETSISGFDIWVGISTWI